MFMTMYESEDDVLLHCGIYCDIVLGCKYPFMPKSMNFRASIGVMILGAPENYTRIFFICVTSGVDN